jgi:hypothetical protein
VAEDGDKHTYSINLPSPGITVSSPGEWGTVLNVGTKGYEYLPYLIQTSSEPQPESRTVFVAYPYSFPRDDYRGVFSEVAEEHRVEFSFADEQLTNKHILEKIEGMMASAAFSLFDITEWNPNVALELGLAYGRRLDYYILFNPTKGNADVLSDVRGIDRIEYRSHKELKSHLTGLVRDQFGPIESEEQPGAGTVIAQLEGLRAMIPDLLAKVPGQPVGGIASTLGVPIDVAQTLIRPLVGKTLETRGVRRGTRYYLIGQAPPEEDEAKPRLDLLADTDIDGT